MDQEIPLAHLVKKGKMTKAPWLMSNDEYAAWKIRVQEDAKAYLFSIGQPLVYSKNGEMIAEYADGTIKKVH